MAGNVFTIGNGWARERCPAHDDRTGSLSTRLDGARGHWCCFVGRGHGELVSLHMRLSGLCFMDAVRELVAGLLAHPLSMTITATTHAPRTPCPADR
ncbi:MAG TPA: CHC2 zinc finger domain-containing protein [Xanthomonadaceae bacterium]